MNGTREALFAFAQTVVDRDAAGARSCLPNPFYQIYEGAALLAGARAGFTSMTTPENGFRLDFDAVRRRGLGGVQLIYVCSPANPTGNVMTLEEWRRLFELSDRHGFVIASDECYSEIYFDEATPPLGALQAAQQLGPRRLRAPRDLLAACPSARTCPACARASSPATPPSCQVPALPHLPRRAMSPPVQAPASPPGATRRTSSRTARLYRGEVRPGDAR